MPNKLVITSDALDQFLKYARTVTSSDSFTTKQCSWTSPTSEKLEAENLFRKQKL
jgi:hypothetical protein